MAAELELVKTALRQYRETTDQKARILRGGFVANNQHVDAEIELDQLGNFNVGVKQSLTAGMLPAVEFTLGKLPQPAMLIADYINPKVAERLKEAEIPFLDTAGNAYIRKDNTLIYIVGLKPADMLKAHKPTRLFKPTGMRVLFGLLCNPDWIDEDYRTLARRTGVARGTIGYLLDDMRELKYLREGKQGRVLDKRQDLIRRWVENYPQQLRPKLTPRQFQVDDGNWWQHFNFDDTRTRLAGEPGGAILTDYLRPQTATIYVDDGELAAIARKIRPAKVEEGGNLLVLDRFWQFDPAPKYPPHLAPPLLIVADLLASGDTRNRECAEVIEEKFLA